MSGLEKLTVVQLKALLKTNNLKVGGVKADLISRLEQLPDIAALIAQQQPLSADMQQAMEQQLQQTSMCIFRGWVGCDEEKQECLGSSSV